MRNPERLSDPSENYHFRRPWTDPFDEIQHISEPAGRVLKSTKDKQARANIAKLLRSAEANQNDDKVALAALREAIKLRREVKASWVEIVVGRAA